MSRFCATCGTEVDETAVFCPTCGQPIDQETESEMPPAPSWPDPEPRPARSAFEPAESAEPVAYDEPAATEPPPRPSIGDDRGWSATRDPDPEAAAADATRLVEPQPSPDVEPADAPAPQTAAPSARVQPAAPREPAAPAFDNPLTMPVTLSAWLTGVGAALGAVGALIALFDGLGSAIDLLLLIGLAAVAASVFLSQRLPNVPQLRLVTLAIVLVAFGVALDRLGFGRAGAGELLLFLGTAAAAIGAIILETGRDQPLGGPSA